MKYAVLSDTDFYVVVSADRNDTDTIYRKAYELGLFEYYTLEEVASDMWDMGEIDPSDGNQLRTHLMDYAWEAGLMYLPEHKVFIDLNGSFFHPVPPNTKEGTYDYTEGMTYERYRSVRA